MSVSLMTVAFKAACPPTQKFVLVALCDSANDQGQCYPSIPTLCEKCSLSERAVQAAVQWLEACGYLTRDMRSGRSTVYWLTPDKGNPRTSCTPARRAPPQQVHHTPAADAPPPPHVVHPTPARRAPITVKEPSVEPKEEKRAVRACPPGVDAQVWDDWLALRKAKRAPVTATVLAGAEAEAGKAGMSLEAFLRVWCRRGSQGLEAAWLKPPERCNGATAEPAWRTEQRERNEAFLGPAAARKTATVIDLEAHDAATLRLG